MPIAHRTIRPTNKAGAPVPKWTHKITGSSFVAGFRLQNNIVVATSPIIHSLMNKRYDAVRDYCAKLAYILEKWED